MARSYQWLRRLFCISFAAVLFLIFEPPGWAAVLAGAVLFHKLLQRPLPHFTLNLFLGGLALRLVIVFSLHPPIISDFLLLLQTARQALAGDFSYLKAEYFSLWGYQSGFLAWDMLWLRLWDNPLCLKLVNAVLGAGTACLLYRLAREWAGERAAQLASVLLAASPFCSALTTLLSNQIPSAFFLTLGLWILVSQDCKKIGFWRFPAAGLALQLGNILRTEGIILLTAIFAWAVFRVVKNRTEWKRLAAGLAALLAVYAGVHMGADALVKASGLHPYGLQNGDPMWKVLTGLNFDSRGGYSSDDWYAIIADLDENGQMSEKSYAVQNRLIHERLSAGPAKLLRHLRNKIEMQWVEDGLHWMLSHLQEYQPELIRFLRGFDRGVFFLTLALAGYGLLGNQKRWETLSLSAYLPYFIFFAAFCAFLIVESQPRYVYLPQQFLSVCAALGLEHLERVQSEKQAQGG